MPAQRRPDDRAANLTDGTAGQTKVVEHGAARGIDVEIATMDPQARGVSVARSRWLVERVRREALIDRVG
ncbi:hypothetical protein Aca07nite_71910 [Actinoplanes capillaceus]|uniref:Uncharacterized protein n=1 Tax=Actinoplanes campanulatus TaxID=113559 RepID=A0ABQ3WUU7_9ACTN|nr:hypothetical protein Aca07nite_71910 [Actinoplanes capillaceus]